MPMSQGTLKQSIIDELESQFGEADDQDKLSKFADAIATAVYDHIDQLAEASGTCTVEITSGSSAGTYTGTSTIPQGGID